MRQPLSNPNDFTSLAFITPTERKAREIRVSIDELEISREFYHTQEQIDELKHKLGVK